MDLKDLTTPEGLHRSIQKTTRPDLQGFKNIPLEIFKQKIALFPQLMQLIRNEIGKELTRSVLDPAQKKILQEKLAEMGFIEIAFPDYGDDTDTPRNPFNGRAIPTSMIYAVKAPLGKPGAQSSQTSSSSSSSTPPMPREKKKTGFTGFSAGFLDKK